MKLDQQLELGLDPAKPPRPTRRPRPDDRAGPTPDDDISDVLPLPSEAECAST